MTIIKRMMTGVILIMFFCGIIFAQTPGPADESKELTWAWKFYSDGNFEAAIEMIQEFFRDNDAKDPTLKNDFPKAHYILAKIYFRGDNQKKCEKNIKQLFQLNPDFQFPQNEEQEFLKLAASVRDKGDLAPQPQTDTITIILKDGTEKKGKFHKRTPDILTIETEVGTENIKTRYISETSPPLSSFPITRITGRAPAEKQRIPRYGKGETGSSPIQANTSHSRVKTLGSRTNLSITGGYAMGMKIEESVMSDTWEDNVGIGADELSTISETTISNFNVSLGLTHFFSRKLGISAAVHFLPPKKFDFRSEFDIAFNFYDNTSDSFSEVWDFPSELSVIPLTLDLVFRLPLGEKASMNIFGGLSVTLTRVQLDANMGFGVPYSDELYIYYDWFRIEMGIDESRTLFGGNIGFDLDFKINKRFGLMMGLQYFYIPVQEYDWELLDRDSWEGETGTLFFDSSPLTNYIEPYLDENDILVPLSINYSFFKIFGGIRIFL